MRLRFEQLASHLERKLAPVYLLAGDEPLQVTEAADAIRGRARQQGFSERVVMEVEPGFDWSRLAQEAASPSLFADRRLLDLRLPTGRPGREGGQALAEYAKNPPPDSLLLITAGRLDGSARNSRWFKSLDQAGAIMQAWAPSAADLPGWIARRMKSRGLQPSPEAAKLLAERVEGNLLAASQEIEKLVLLQGSGQVDAEAVAGAVSDSARFNIFELADAALAGDGGRCRRIVAGLRSEGSELPLVLWALARELRILAAAARTQARGGRVDKALADARAWKNRWGLYRKALQRNSAPRWQGLMRAAAELDRSLKGASPDCVIRGGRDDCAWDQVLDLCLGMAGKHPIASRA